MEHVSSVLPTGKFPEKVENLKRWSRFPGWNFRTESRVPFTFLVVCTSSRSTLGHRHVPGFMTKWNNFLPIGNSTLLPPKFPGFFPKWKAPIIPAKVWFLSGKRWLANNMTGQADVRLCKLGGAWWLVKSMYQALLFSLSSQRSKEANRKIYIIK